MAQSRAKALPLRSLPCSETPIAVSPILLSGSAKCLSRPAYPFACLSTLTTVFPLPPQTPHHLRLMLYPLTHPTNLLHDSCWKHLPKSPPLAYSHMVQTFGIKRRNLSISLQKNIKPQKGDKKREKGTKKLQNSQNTVSKWQ